MSFAETARALIEARFDVDPELPAVERGAACLERLLSRRSHRAYTGRPVEPALLRLICAAALSAPSKSDLQQADIIVIEDPAQRAAIADLVPSMPWVREAPAFAVICANNRRQRRLAELTGKPFANDHLDAFFNATVDAAIVLATLNMAAEAVGLGTCPISVLRDRAGALSDILVLPDHVLPVAGLCLGWPCEGGPPRMRLPLDVTLHTDRFDDTGFDEHLAAYDRRRAETQPYESQRDPERFGTAELYGWSEDKARQYATPQRADFGAFVRAKGFRLE